MMVIAVLGVLALAWVLRLGWQLMVAGPPQQGAPPEAIEGTGEVRVLPVRAYKTSRIDFEDILPSLGTVKGFHEIDLSFQTSGQVEEVLVKEGAQVKRGDLLARLVQREAQLKLKYNELELEKTQALYELGGVEKRRLDQTEIEYQSAKEELEKTKLTASRDGKIGSVLADVGEYATPNQPAAILVDPTMVYVEVGIVEKDLVKIQLKQQAVVTVDAYPNDQFQGELDAIAPIIEGRSRTQKVKIKVPNEDLRLIPGMFARAQILVFQQRQALTIPATCLTKNEKGFAVFVVQEEKAEAGGEPLGKAEPRQVQITYLSSDYAVIGGGLKEGELVVIEPSAKLEPGAPVQITELQEAPAQ